MPYIASKEKRKSIDSIIDKLLSDVGTAGELNYAITRLIHLIIKRDGLHYYTLNNCIGVLECAKLELYRAVAGPYESKKRRENGAISKLDSLSLEDVR